MTMLKILGALCAIFLAVFVYVGLTADPELAGYSDEQLRAYVDKMNDAREHCEDYGSGEFEKVSHSVFSCGKAQYALVPVGASFRLMRR